MFCFPFVRYSLGFAACIAAFSLFAVPCQSQTFTDDFSRYHANTEGSPNWQAFDVGIAMRDNQVKADDGRLLWQQVPYADEVGFSCNVTVDSISAGDEDWGTAGIGIMSDERNYWLLNLVRSPANDGFRHSIEFQEMLDGRWLASGMDGSRLQALEHTGSRYDWKLKQTYRLEVKLTSALIAARVLEGQREVAKFAWNLQGKTPAVRAGRPLLKASHMRVRFDNVQANVVSTAVEPVEQPQHYPAWTSTTERKLAPGTGFFATHQEPDGRWWLVDPEGRAFFDVGVDHCKFNGHWCQALGYAPYHRKMQAKFGTPEAWADSTAARLKNWGFTTVAAGHDSAMRHRGFTHILFASLGAGFARRDWICEPIHWTGFPNVFSPEWERHCRLVARRMAKECKDDPWCLGIFYDNELEWYGKKGFLVDELFQLSADHTGKRALWSWLLQRYGDVAGVNRALGTHFADANAFLSSTTVPSAGEGLTQVRDEFLKVIAERYFKVCYESLREADTQHLTMGCRFAGRTPEPILEIAGRYTDVFTINTYPRVDLDRGKLLGVQRQLRDYYGKVQKPFAITEWSFPALDSGLPCQHGAGMRVDTQQQKARCYEIFANGMADLPFMVGYHYFMWVDEPAQGISESFPEDSNYGLVDVDDQPYAPLVEMATKVNAAAHQRHQSATISGDIVMTYENGSLQLRNDTDWPAFGKLTAFIGGKLITSNVTVPAQQTVTPADHDWSKAAHVLLEEWDGVVTRIAPAAQLGSPSVINTGTHVARQVPVVHEGRQLSAAWVDSIAPGRPVRLPAVRWQTAPSSQLTLKHRALRLTADSTAGHLLDAVVAQSAQGELPLGRLDFALHQIVNGANHWTTPNKLEERQLRGTTDGIAVLDLTVSHIGSGSGNGPASYRAQVRAVFFKDQPLILVRPLWVESLDDRPWLLDECFVFCRPEIGGDRAGDRRGGADAPNYYRRAEYWTDGKSGGVFGAISPDESWDIHFWSDEGGGLHPDARRKVDLTLTKGKRWSADEWSYLWVYALPSEDQVNAVIGKAKQARDLLVTGN